MEPGPKVRDMQVKLKGWHCPSISWRLGGEIGLQTFECHSWRLVVGSGLLDCEDIDDVASSSHSFAFRPVRILCV